MTNTAQGAVFARFEAAQKAGRPANSTVWLNAHKATSELGAAMQSLARCKSDLEQAMAKAEIAAAWAEHLPEDAIEANQRVERRLAMVKNREEWLAKATVTAEAAVAAWVAEVPLRDVASFAD